MRASACIGLLALVACGPSEGPFARAAEIPIAGAPAAAATRGPEDATAPTVQPIANGVPHGAQIAAVAITDQADAAVTIDQLDGVRLWPTLDGTREPLAIVA